MSGRPRHGWAWYGAGPRHLAAIIGGGAVSAYAVTRLPDLSTLQAVAVWFALLLVVHDLVLFPLYTAVDTLLVGRRPRRDAGRGWSNYVRVPFVLSGLLLLAWFPLVLRLSAGYSRTSGRAVEPFLWHWLAISACLFGAAGLLRAARLLVDRRRTRGARDGR